MQTPKNFRKRTYARECQFPGCDKIFSGNNVSKYCKTHKQSKYKKLIYEKKKKKEDLNNQIIKHGYEDPQHITIICALDGCNTSFDLQLFGGVQVYPKYCECHRNEYQREQFLNKQKDKKNEKSTINTAYNRNL